MIEFHAVSLLIGVAIGSAVATLYHMLPKKRRRRTKGKILAAKAEAAGERDASFEFEVK